MVVGPDKKRFIVHTYVLVQSSDFLKACCNGADERKETASRTAELPEANVEAFLVYLHWPYSNELVVENEDKVEECRDLDVATRARLSFKIWKPLHALAVMGGQLSNIAFSNAVIDRMVRTREAIHVISTQYIKRMYEELPPTTPIRRLLVDLWISKAQEGMAEEYKQQLTHDFLIDLVTGYDKILRKKTMKKEPN